nr:50S ribosomal protein L18-like [Ipomoea batatas]
MNSGKFSVDASQAGGSSPSSNVHNIKRWRQLCLGNVFAPTAGGLSTGSPPPGGIRTTFIDCAALSSDATSEGVAMQVPTTTAVSLTIESELRVVFVGGFVGGNCVFEGPSAPGLCATIADNCLTSFSRLARAMAWLWDVMDREETVVDNVSILSNCNSKALTDFCKALMADSVFKSFTNKYVNAQVVHTPTATVAAAASTQEKSLRLGMIETNENTRDVAAAAKIGKLLGERLQVKGIPAVSIFFNRDQRYHGKVKAVIDSIRGEGIKLV